MSALSPALLEIFAIARRIIPSRYLPEPADVPEAHQANLLRDNELFERGVTGPEGMDIWFRTQEAISYFARHHADPERRTKYAVMLIEAETSMLALLRECERKVKARATP
jgi:hypothetical protein